MLYDTYVIKELKCDSNARFKLIPAFEVVVSRNKVTVDLGTLTDEYEKEITIHTTATDKKTGEKMIVAGKDIKIVDKVTLDGLEAGTKYKLSGWQMLKEENAELLIDGKRVDSDYTFTADSEKVTVEITYSFDGSSLGGQNLVTFELPNIKTSTMMDRLFLSQNVSSKSIRPLRTRTARKKSKPEKM